MDGTNRTIIVTGPDIKKIVDLALDFKESLLFWVDNDKKVGTKDDDKDDDDDKDNVDDDDDNMNQLSDDEDIKPLLL